MVRTGHTLRPDGPMRERHAAVRAPIVDGRDSLAAVPEENNRHAAALDRHRLAGQAVFRHDRMPVTQPIVDRPEPSSHDWPDTIQRRDGEKAELKSRAAPERSRSGFGRKGELPA